MITVQEMGNLYPPVFPWNRLVQIQCIKLTNVVKRTDQLLDEAGCTEGRNLLKGR